MDDDQADSARHAERSGGRLTTMIPRPTRVRAAEVRGSRLKGWRRRGDRADRISSTRRSAWLFGLAGLVISGAIAAALFGLPVRTWFEQDDQIAALERELNELETVNLDLGQEVERLQTDDGVREAAREELGQIEPGDNRATLTALPDLPGALPIGWPYSQLNQMINLRAGAALAAANPDAVTTTVAAAPAANGGFQPVEAPTTAPVPAPDTTVAVAPASTSVDTTTTVPAAPGGAG